MRIRSGYTLVELLIVVSILAIFAGLVIPSSYQTSYDQLLSAARVLASDLAYARSLAVTNNDLYTVTFSGSGNSYTLVYGGSNPALINLPSTPFRSPTDPPSQQIQRLADLPEVTAAVNLLAAADVNGVLMTAVANVQFTGLGGTTRSDPTWIWLASGAGSSRRYLVVTINPVTGLTSIGTFSGAAPSNSLLLAAAGTSPGMPPFGLYVFGNGATRLRPEGAQPDSPGHRPGERLVSSSMSAPTGRNPWSAWRRGNALSGLRGSWGPRIPGLRPWAIGLRPFGAQLTGNLRW